MSLFIQMRYFILLAVCLGLILPGGVISEDTSNSSTIAPLMDNLTFYTEQLPPYNYAENDTVKGFTVDILKEIAGKAGMAISPGMIQVVPWDEGYQAALTGNRTVIFSTARIPERESLFQWVGPISAERYVLFALRDSNLTINSPEDLRGLRIGAMAKDASIGQLLGDGVNADQLVTADNVSELITKLKDGEIDLWAYPEISGKYCTEQLTGDIYLFKVAYPFDEVGIYYAFSKDIPNSTVQAFQKALDDLKQEKNENGTSGYEKILGPYYPESVNPKKFREDES